MNEINLFDIFSKNEQLLQIGNYLPTTGQRFNFGNDHLYYFCEEHPLPKSTIALENTSNNIPSIDKDNPNNSTNPNANALTQEEAAFADKLWLIGRSYAARVELYNYQKGINTEKGKKPNDKWIGKEGYESLYGDIARIILREECHDSSNPVSYLRGIKTKIYVNENSSLQNAFKELEKVNDFLEKFHDLPNSYKSLTAKKSSDLYRESNNESLDAKVYFEDFNILMQVSNLTVQFARLLGAAQLIRDAALWEKTCEINPPRKNKKMKKDPQLEWSGNKKTWKFIFDSYYPSISLSFSSKFLHFHKPQLFFIYDSISNANLESIEIKLNKSDSRDAVSRTFKIYKTTSSKSRKKTNATIIDLLFKSIPDLKYESKPFSYNKSNTFHNNKSSKDQDTSAKLKQHNKYDPKSTSSTDHFLDYNNRCNITFNNYLAHITKELILACGLFSYLLIKRETNKKLYNETIESLMKGKCYYPNLYAFSSPENKSKSLLPCHYYITRLIDIFVTNSK